MALTIWVNAPQKGGNDKVIIIIESFENIFIEEKASHILKIKRNPACYNNMFSMFLQKALLNQS